MRTGDLEFLTYRGDKTHLIGRLMGPNTLGEYFKVEACEYDGNRSRVGLRPLHPHEWLEALRSATR